VIASGGVTTLDDIRQLGTVDGICGVIVGKAIYEQRFTVEQALAALAGRRRHAGEPSGRVSPR
jgi:phosphoribosylformimino-5-aminoimidazole carboxamide ribonucleotide (ProFAR) isomerase